MRPPIDWRPWAAASLALVLGLFRLDLQPIWLDEFVTLSVSSASDERFLSRVLGDQSFTGLYYLLMRGWAKPVGPAFMVAGALAR